MYHIAKGGKQSQVLYVKHPIKWPFKCQNTEMYRYFAWLDLIYPVLDIIDPKGSPHEKLEVSDLSKIDLWVD